MSLSDDPVQLDLTSAESTFITALASHSLTCIKLVHSSTSFQLALFLTSPHKIDEVAFLEDARKILPTRPSFPLVGMISFARQLTKMPIDEDRNIDVPALRSIAEEHWAAERSSHQNGHATPPQPQLIHTVSQPRQLAPQQPATGRMGDLGNTLSLDQVREPNFPLNHNFIEVGAGRKGYTPHQ